MDKFSNSEIYHLNNHVYKHQILKQKLIPSIITTIKNTNLYEKSEMENGVVWRKRF